MGVRKIGQWNSIEKGLAYTVPLPFFPNFRKSCRQRLPKVKHFSLGRSRSLYLASARAGLRGPHRKKDRLYTPTGPLGRSVASADLRPQTTIDEPTMPTIIDLSALMCARLMCD